MEKVASASRFRPLFIGIGIFFLLTLLSGGFSVPSLLAYHLGTGWFRHPIVNLPHLNWNPPTILLSLAACTVAIVLLRRFIGWPFRRTLAATAIFLTTTAAAVAMTGIIHELAWLARSPITYDRNNAARVEAMNNGRQLWILLAELAQQGVFPQDIHQLATHAGPHADKLATYRTPQSNHHREHFVLLHPGKNINSLSPETPILAAFGFNKNRIVVVLASASVDLLTPAEFHSLMEKAP